MAKTNLNVSLASVADLIRRFVEFVDDVDAHADAETDVELQGLVRRLHDDLMEMR